MLKVMVTPLNLIATAAVAVVMFKALNPEVGVEVQGRTVRLDFEVSHDSSKAVAEALNTLEHKSTRPILLKIESPGGSVMDGREVVEEIRSSSVQVNTITTNYAMSMGMDFLLMGKERFATPDALGMIHRGSAGNISYAVLKAQLRHLEGLVPTSKEEAINLKGAIERLRSTVDILDKLFEPTFTRLAEIRKTLKDPTPLDRIVDALKEGDRDIFLTAEEMLEAGIVTQIVNSVEEAEKITNEGR